MPFNLRRNPRWPAVVQRAVPGVDDSETFRRIEAPRPRRTPRELRGCGPNRARSQSRAWTIGGREVERDTGNGDVDSVEVTGIRSPEKAERARVRRFITQSVGRSGSERLVAGSFPWSCSSARIRTSKKWADSGSRSGK